MFVLKLLLLATLAFSLAIVACNLGQLWINLLASKPLLAVGTLAIPLAVLVLAIASNRN